MHILANKSDLNDQAYINNDMIEELKNSVKLEVYRISAKTGENIQKAFYTTISTLTAFDDFNGDKENLLELLEIENKQESNNYSYSSNNRDIISLETGKNKEQTENEGKFKIKEGSNNIASHDNHTFPKKKSCNC